MTPEQLRVKLAAVLEKASESGRISTAEVKAFFAGEELSEEQMNLVYDFLLSRKIVVEGYVKKEEEPASGEADAEPAWSAEEQRYLDMYMEDLSAIREEASGEWERLVAAVRGGDVTAKRRITELLMPAVCELAQKMYREGVFLQDLIQEGNLALVLAADKADSLPLNDREAGREAVLSIVRGNLQALLEEQTDVHARDKRMVEKVEDFKDGIEILKEELGRKVYLDEAADFMNITEEEAADILKLAGENVEDEDVGE